MNIKNVTVAGGGVLGSQIAFQTAYSGFPVNLYDISDEAIEKTKEKMHAWQKAYKRDLGATDKQVEKAYNNITFYTDLAQAVKGVDLVIEAVPEVVEIKTNFYKQLAQVADEKTIFVSNSSTMLPSQFAQVSGRPEKFLNLHFANEIWKHNTAEIMKHEGTSQEVFEEIIEFAKAIGMVPLPLYKEQPGYILNSLLVPFLDAAQKLVVNGIADPHTVDKTWMIATGAPQGPFAILDVVGINTPYNLSLAKAKAGDKEAEKVAEYLKREFLDKGRMGVQNGKGFYDYPNPKFLDPDFLT